MKRPRLVPRWMIMGMIGAAVAGTGAGIVLALVFATYEAPSASMWPTVAVGDRIFANRFVPPNRGAVIAFRFPEHREQSFVKRIVGLPGDRIGIAKTGELSINGWTAPRCNVGRIALSGSDGKREGMLAVEFLGTATYLVFEDHAAPGGTADSEWTVAAGEYFVLGDNRRNSHDSRMWYGGKGGGVRAGDVRGVVYGRDEVRLPTGEGAESLAPGLAACLAKRPAQTEPPRPQ